MAFDATHRDLHETERSAVQVFIVGHLAQLLRRPAKLGTVLSIQRIIAHLPLLVQFPQHIERADDSHQDARFINDEKPVDLEGQHLGHDRKNGVFR